MKKLILLSLIAFNFISCMEVETPVCNTKNRIDLKKMPKEITLNWYDENFEIMSAAIAVNRVGKGVYDLNGQGKLETCKVAGKTLVQGRTEYNTYTVSSFSIGQDNISFPEFMVDKRILDKHNLSYQYAQRNQLEASIVKDEALIEYAANNLQNSTDVIVVKKLTPKVIKSLKTQGATYSFSYNK